MLVLLLRAFYLFFFFNDTATTEIYTLSLHDALPISHRAQLPGAGAPAPARAGRREAQPGRPGGRRVAGLRAAHEQCRGHLGFGGGPADAVGRLSPAPSSGGQPRGQRPPSDAPSGLATADRAHHATRSDATPCPPGGGGHRPRDSGGDPVEDFRTFLHDEAAR